MPTFNLVLSQFFFLSLLLGDAIRYFLIGPIIKNVGLTEALASQVASITSIMLIAFFVFGRWIFLKKHSLSPTVQPDSQYRTGSVYVAIANVLFLLTTLFAAFQNDPVVGGLAGFYGGGITILLWLFGWHLTGFFRIY